MALKVAAACALLLQPAEAEKDTQSMCRQMMNRVASSGSTDAEISAGCRASFQPGLCSQMRSTLGNLPWSAGRIDTACTEIHSKVNSRKMQEVLENLKDKTQEASDAVQDKAQDATDKMQDKVQAVGDAVQDTAQDASDQIQNGLDATAQKKDTAQNTGEEVADQMQEKGDEMKDSAKQVIQGITRLYAQPTEKHGLCRKMLHGVAVSRHSDAQISAGCRANFPEEMCHQMQSSLGKLPWTASRIDSACQGIHGHVDARKMQEVLENLKDKAQEATDAMQDTAQDASDQAKGGLDDATAKKQSTVQSQTDALQSQGEEMADQMQDKGNEMKDSAKQVLEGITRLYAQPTEKSGLCREMLHAVAVSRHSGAQISAGCHANFPAEMCHQMRSSLGNLPWTASQIDSACQGISGQADARKMQEVLENLKDKAQAVGDAVQDKAQDATDKMQDKVQTVGDAVQDTAQDASDQIQNGLDATAQKKDTVQNTGEEVADQMQEKGDEMKDTAKQVVEGITRLYAEPRAKHGLCRQMLQGVAVSRHNDDQISAGCRASFPAEMCSQMQSSLGKLPWTASRIDTACRGIHSQIDARKMQEVLENLKDKAQAVGDAVQDTAQDATENMKDKAQAVGDAMQDTAQDASDQVQNGLDDATAKKDTVQSQTEAMQSKAEEMADDAQQTLAESTRLYQDKKAGPGLGWKFVSSMSTLLCAALLTGGVAMLVQRVSRPKEDVLLEAVDELADTE